MRIFGIQIYSSSRYFPNEAIVLTHEHNSNTDKDKGSLIELYLKIGVKSFGVSDFRPVYEGVSVGDGERPRGDDLGDEDMTIGCSSCLMLLLFIEFMLFIGVIFN